MNSIEKDIYNYIRDKDIDFYQEVININISIDNYQFSLTATLEIQDYYAEMHIDCNLLRNYYEFISLSDDFRLEIAKYFETMINFTDDHIVYLLQLHNCLNEQDIEYLA